MNKKITYNRVEKDVDNPFTRIDNRLLKDKRLTGDEFRLMCLILSNRDNFEFNMDFMRDKCGVGVDKFKVMKRNLKEYGYIESVRNGHKWSWIVNERSTIDGENPHCEGVENNPMPKDGETTHVNNNNRKQKKLKEKKSPLFSSVETEQGVTEVCEYFSQKVGIEFDPMDEESKHLRDRIEKDGLTVKTAKGIINLKFEEWHKSEKMKRHLNPKVLFKSKNFNSYIKEYKRSLEFKKENLTWGQELTLEVLNHFSDDDKLLIDMEFTKEWINMGFESFKSGNVKMELIRNFIRHSRGTVTYRENKPPHVVRMEKERIEQRRREAELKAQSLS
ncbi:conserved phage C-terminal domain-containing protein [Draconibacterium sediminis]|uniref:Phage conserved hypothetical protein C-terminal domain-containing protein n=1 Tax=Draconibacterium sediminis TaxID=1544798 RepID=A0A0D8J7Y7_9BACT|nr:conserved phage C-terminal domain-containing protein [Draconibacterium sediminis]KJF43095.1 hypothetical protein LH29_17095 [Draconibacterium sediminis]